MFVLDNLISFHAVNEMMKQINSITGFISIWVQMFHLNFMSNLLNFRYIVYSEESQKASVGSRSSLPSSNNFLFFLDRTVSCNSLHVVILVTTFAPLP